MGIESAGPQGQAGRYRSFVVHVEGLQKLVRAGKTELGFRYRRRSELDLLLTVLNENAGFAGVLVLNRYCVLFQGIATKFSQILNQAVMRLTEALQ